MLMHIIAHNMDISPEELERLRSRRIKDVMRTHGEKRITVFQRDRCLIFTG